MWKYRIFFFFWRDSEMNIFMTRLMATLKVTPTDQTRKQIIGRLSAISEHLQCSPCPGWQRKDGFPEVPAPNNPTEPLLPGRLTSLRSSYPLLVRHCFTFWKLFQEKWEFWIKATWISQTYTIRNYFLNFLFLCLFLPEHPFQSRALYSGEYFVHTMM